MAKKISTPSIKAMIAENTPFVAQTNLKYWYVFGAITKAQRDACLKLVQPVVINVSVKSRHTLTCK